MSLDLTQLDDETRLLFEVELQPVQGKRFQPTGFPDLGAATYQAGGMACLLVESAQSMANRLEMTLWDEGQNQPIAEANGISYVRIHDDKSGDFLSASILEAHRMNSVYIEKSVGNFFTGDFTKALMVDKARPVNRTAIVETLLRFDINSLLHGVFLESIDGRIRIARAISAFIEATEIQTVASGGVKNDRIQPTKQEGKAAADGFGNVPFHREEFTAQKITAYFSIDLQQIRAYGLGEAVERLLIVLAMFKIRRLLDGSLRLRTACDFEVAGDLQPARRPDGFHLPSAADLTKELKQCIAQNRAQMEVTTVTYKK